MANRTVYVDGSTSGTPGTDGAHYATLSAAMAGEVGAAPDLVANTAILNVEISLTSADTTAVVVNGFTTSASYYVNIYTTAAARHAGVWSESKYRLTAVDVAADSDVGALTITDPYTRVTGLQVKTTQSSNYKSCLGIVVILAGDTFGNGRCLARDCLVVSDAGAYNNGGCLGVKATGSPVDWINCVVVGMGSGTSYTGGDLPYASNGMWVNYFDGITRIFNCTVIGFHTGFYQQRSTDASNYAVFTNCISNDSTSAGYAVSGANSTGDHNLSDRDDAFGTNPINSALTFANAAGLNYALAAGDTAAIGAGVDLSATIGDSLDIAGATRTGTWDLGAFDYASATANTPVHLLRTRQLGAFAL